MDWEVGTVKGLVHPECVLARSRAATPRQVFEEAAQALAAVHGIDAAALAQRLAIREERASTACGFGFAVPHADAWKITRPQGVYLRSCNPIGFALPGDAQPVHDVLLLVAPRPARPAYTTMLHHYLGLVAQASFRHRLLELESAAQMWLLWRENEWSLEAPLTPALPGQDLRHAGSQ